MRRLCSSFIRVVALLGVLTTTALHAQATASAEWGCGGLPPYQLVEVSPFRMVMQLEVAHANRQCLGVAARVQVGTRTRYRVIWFPCPGKAGFRFGGDSLTMSRAFAAASRPPRCL